MSSDHFVLGPRYVFYRIAEWAEKRGDPLPLMSSLCMTAALIASNVLFLYVSATAFCGATCAPVFERLEAASNLARRSLATLLGLGLILGLYLHWVRSGRYTAFFAVYRNEAAQSRRTGTRLVVGYLAVSIIVWIVWFVRK
jgi:hypothetical protein